MRLAGHFAGMVIALAIALIPRAEAAAGGPDSVPPATTPASSLPAAGQDRALLGAGELRFRRGDFEGAGQFFRQAAALNPDCARAWWGLGRIEQLYFRRDAARDLFSRAYRLDPRDAEVVLSFLGFVRDPAARAVLLRNVMVLSRDREPERAQSAAAHLAMESRLAGREAGVLASPYRAYRIPLGGFRPAGSAQRGLTIEARINGGRALRLVLDTGARGILLHSGAARELGLDPVTASLVGGVGAGGASAATVSLARTVAFGELEFRDCPVEVSGGEIAPGADGVLGPSLFERFLVRIDAGAKLLELAPHEAEAGAGAPGALDLDRLLLVRAAAAGGREGWFLLDTGAAFTAIAADRAAATVRAETVALAGAQGLAAAFRVSPVALRVAGRSLADTEAVALDLGAISRREGVEISGILGYPALSRWPLTIDFRNGTLLLGDAR